MLNIYIVYHLDNTSHSFHPKLKSCLFGPVNVTKKHSDFNGQGLSGYGLCFYTDYVFTNPSQSFAYNAIVFGVDSQENDNMLVIGKGNVKFNNKTINVSASYGKTNSKIKDRLVLSLHYNGKSRHIFAMGEKITDFTAKDSEINSDPICLGNISKNVTESDTKRTGLYGSVYHFSVDYKPNSVNDILKIHKYLMREYL